MAQRCPLHIEALHVINLDRRPERMRRFVNRIRNELAWDIPIVRHAAIDTSAWHTEATDDAPGMHLSDFVEATQLPVIERGFRREEAELSRGAVGCTLSHMALWMYLAAHRELDYLAIFEDDAVWAQPQHPPLEAVVEHLALLPSTWDVLLLGAQHLEVKTAADTYSELMRFWATHAYIIHRDAVPKLLRNMLPIRAQLDAALSEKTRTDDLRVFGLNQVMFSQNPKETDIQVPLHLPDGTIRQVDGTCTGPDDTRQTANCSPPAP